MSFCLIACVLQIPLSVNAVFGIRISARSALIWLSDPVAMRFTFSTCHPETLNYYELYYYLITLGSYLLLRVNFVFLGKKKVRNLKWYWRNITFIRMLKLGSESGSTLRDKAGSESETLLQFYCWTNNCLVRWKFANIWCAGWSVGRENPPPT